MYTNFLFHFVYPLKVFVNYKNFYKHLWSLMLWEEFFCTLMYQAKKKSLQCRSRRPLIDLVHQTPTIFLDMVEGEGKKSRMSSQKKKKKSWILMGRVVPKIDFYHKRIIYLSLIIYISLLIFIVFYWHDVISLFFNGK